MPTVNEQLLSRQIAHQVGLERLKSGTVRELLELLRESEADLLDLLAQRVARLVRIGHDTGPFRTRDLKRRIAAVRKIREELEAALLDRNRLLRREMRSRLHDLNGYEVDFQQRMVAALTGGEISLVAPSAELLAAIIDAKPFHGRLLSEWVADLSADTVRRLERVVNSGLIGGSGTDEIVRQAARQLDISRRHIETWVRSAVGHTTGEAKDALYARNTGVIGAVIWLSTLDSRTSEDCIIRDNLKYSNPDHEPIGHAVPWGAGPGRIHPRCRSTSLPFLGKGSDLGKRASKYGPVPAKTTFNEWAKTIPREDLVKVVGARRAKLLREGGLEIRDLFTARGDFYSLEELRRRES